MFNLMFMKESGWKLLGAAVAVLGVIFLVGGSVVYVSNYQEYVAVLIVFGGIFLVIGTGLVAIAFFEKNTADDSRKAKN